MTLAGIGIAVLEGHQVVEVESILDPRWRAMWDQHDARLVARTQLGKRTVSTVFLGIDHGWGGVPRWFETMVFGPGMHELGSATWRYATWDEAAEGHQLVVDELRRRR